MTDDSLKNAAQAAAGSIESAAGDVLDDPEMQFDGMVKQVKGRAGRVADQALDSVDDLRHRANASVDELRRKANAAAISARERAREAYDEASVRVSKAAARVDPMVRERPYAAIGIAAAAGLVLGLLLAGATSAVYIRRHHDDY